MDQTTSVNCPLCNTQQHTLFHQDKRRLYRRCHNCHLVFVAACQHLLMADEKAIYDLHENAIDDPGYRQFLSRLCDPLAEQLPPQAKGLDYGCGPGPALAEMLQSKGFDMQVFDPFYANDDTVLQQEYDFISCTEVVEHFRKPKVEFDRLFALLNDGGTLAVMTKLVIDAAAFSRWHYKNDLTHISFYSIETMRWLADRYHARASFFLNDVIFLRKTETIQADNI